MTRSDAGRRERRLPGEPGVWLFIAGDLIVFALMFLTFLSYRSDDIARFDRSRRLLDTGLGALNTVLLLTASWLVAKGMAALRTGRLDAAHRLLLGGAAGGIGFLAIKVLEYHAKFAAGITILTDDFFMYYFMLTGIHLVHVVMGVGVLLLLAAKARSATPADVRLFENGATFWHLVDLLWIILFPLLYLIAG